MAHAQGIGHTFTINNHLSTKCHLHYCRCHTWNLIALFPDQFFGVLAHANLHKVWFGNETMNVSGHNSVQHDMQCETQVGCG